MISEPTAIIIAAFISLPATIVGYNQYVIQRDKLRLTLYKRRFAIYDAALTIRKTREHLTLPDDMRALLSEFGFTIGEAKFLFAEKDGVFYTLQEIKECADAIMDMDYLINVERKLNEDYNPEDDRQENEKFRRKNLIEFYRLYGQLDRQIGPYLDFRKIHGEGFWRDYWWG